MRWQSPLLLSDKNDEHVTRGGKGSLLSLRRSGIGTSSSPSAPTSRPLLQNLKAGRPLEDEALNGIAVKKGAELGLPTPYNFSLYALLSQVKTRA